MVKVILAKKAPSHTVEITFPYNNPEGMPKGGGVGSIKRSGIFIDNISLTYPIDDKKAKASIRKAIEGLANKSSIPFKVEPLKTKQESTYLSGVKLIGGKGSKKWQTAIIQCHPKYPKHNYLRVSYNPSCFSDKGEHEALWKFLATLFKMHIDPLHFYKAAKVTRLELAQDLYDVMPEHVAVEGHNKGSKKRQRHYYLSNTGKLETMYIGLSKNMVTVYNKAKHAKKKKLEHYEPATKQRMITRIEIRQEKSFLLPKLKTIANPFDELTLYDLRPLQMVSGVSYTDGGKAKVKISMKATQKHLHTFADIWVMRGLKEAMRLIPHKEYRKQYQAVADSCKVQSWHEDMKANLSDFHRQCDEIRKGLTASIAIKDATKLM